MPAPRAGGRVPHHPVRDPLDGFDDQAWDGDRVRAVAHGRVVADELWAFDSRWDFNQDGYADLIYDSTAVLIFWGPILEDRIGDDADARFPQTSGSWSGLYRLRRRQAPGCRRDMPTLCSRSRLPRVEYRADFGRDRSVNP